MVVKISRPDTEDTICNSNFNENNSKKSVFKEFKRNIFKKEAGI